MAGQEVIDLRSGYDTEPNAFIYNPDVLYTKKKCLINSPQWSSVGNGHSPEIKTKYDAGLGEDVKTVLNSHFVMGADRDGGKLSGYGGRGFSGASSIDLIAGLSGPYPTDREKTQKDFSNDAARIYLSQMTDIDDYFSISPTKVKVGSLGVSIENSKQKSGIGIKADDVRIIARENIKLVTYHKVINSVAKKSNIGGIDIIAGIDVASSNPKLSLQPMVKGNNLLALLKEIRKSVESVQANLSYFLKQQKKINDIFSKHVHQSGKAGMPTSPIIGNNGQEETFKLLTDVIPQIISGIVNDVKISGVYFTEASQYYINSRYNNVN